MSGRVPLHGYNTNYRKKGQVYHIQTEDLGHPLTAIVTQVFIGGTIIATKRSEYFDLLQVEKLAVPLRERMQKQHKAMLIALRDDKLESGAPPQPSAPPAPADVPAKPTADELAKPTAHELAKPTAHEPAIPAAPATIEAPPGLALPSPVPRSSDPMRDTVQMELPPEFYQEIEAGAPDEDGVIIEDLPPGSLQRSSAKMIPKPPPLPPGATPVPRNAPAPQIQMTPPPFTVTRLEAPKSALAPRSMTPTMKGHSLTPLPQKLGPTRKPTKALKPKLQVIAEPQKAEPQKPRLQKPKLQVIAEPQKTEPQKTKPRRAQLHKAEPRKGKISTMPPKSSRRPRIFAEISKPVPGLGEEQVGERSLDEVILSYLSDDLQEE